MKRVLFLCTGNYYRSRFAEVLFNHLAREAGVQWVADSCGLRVRPDGVVNSGAMSDFAREGLVERGIAQPHERWPRQVTEADFLAADVVIALKESEHRVLVEASFPGHAARVRYWTVHDLDVALPTQALPELEKLVRQLFTELNR
jgi:protein-tyrosine phosphatase